MRYLARYALLEAGDVAEHVLISLEGTRISAVQRDYREEMADVIKLNGLVTPGFANCHSHAFHRLLRGRTNSSGGDFWSWQRVMYGAAERLDPDSYRELATLVYLEMVKAGFTSVGEFHYLHHDSTGRPYADPNEMGYALHEAAERVGLRLGLLDACYLHGGLGKNGYEDATGVQRRFSDGSVDAYLARIQDMRSEENFHVSRAIHSVRAVNDEEMTAVFDGADLVHLHLSEQVAENERCRDYWSRSPMELVRDCGGLHSGATLVHANHLSESDFGILGESHATVCACPTTEEDLGDGVAPIARFLSQGTLISVGTDQNTIIDPFAEACQLENHERLGQMRRGVLTPTQLWSSLCGHGSIGFPDAGALAPGMLADLVEIDLESLRTFGTLPHEVIMSARPADVRTVIVSGTPVVTDFHHPLEGSLEEITRLLSSLFLS